MRRQLPLSSCDDWPDCGRWAGRCRIGFRLGAAISWTRRRAAGLLVLLERGGEAGECASTPVAGGAALVVIGGLGAERAGGSKTRRRASCVWLVELEMEGAAHEL